MKTLNNKRILICGKGGSGKSSIVSLLGVDSKKTDTIMQNSLKKRKVII